LELCPAQLSGVNNLLHRKKKPAATLSADYRSKKNVSERIPRTVQNFSKQGMYEGGVVFGQLFFHAAGTAWDVVEFWWCGDF
jgi:hypothetical protein